MKLTGYKQQIQPAKWLMWIFVAFLIGTVLLWVATVRDGNRLLDKDGTSRMIKVPYH